jgi:hypothetical protein
VALLNNYFNIRKEGFIENINQDAFLFCDPSNTKKPKRLTYAMICKDLTLSRETVKKSSLSHLLWLYHKKVAQTQKIDSFEVFKDQSLKNHPPHVSELDPQKQPPFDSPSGDDDQNLLNLEHEDTALFLEIRHHILLNLLKDLTITHESLATLNAQELSSYKLKLYEILTKLITKNTLK